MRLTASSAVAAFVCALALAHPARADRIAVHASAVSLDDDPSRTTVGALTYLGGVSLTSPDRRFGGLSALVALDGGKGVVAISDNGYWFTARLVHDRNGRLVGMADAALGPLIGPAGRTLHRKTEADAESLAPLADGLAVGFEHDHRIWKYPYGRMPFDRPPSPLPSPPGLDRAPPNLGLEALTALPGRRLFALTEGLKSGPGTLRGWLGSAPGFRTWRKFDWVKHGEFAPSGAATLPDGSVLLLERRFSLIGGFAARILRLAPGDIRPGARLDGRVIAAFEGSVIRDNYEGIDVARGPGDRLVLYLVSDDNYNPLQRTLLLEFALGE